MGKHRVRLKSVDIGEGMYLTHLGVAIKSDTYYFYIEKLDDLTYRQKADLLENYLRLQEFIENPKEAKRRFRNNRAKGAGIEEVFSVINRICEERGFSFDEVNIPSRESPLVKTRQIIAYVLSERLKMTHIEIGKWFSHSRRKDSKDHTFSMYSINRLKKIMSVDQAYRDEVNYFLNLKYES